MCQSLAGPGYFMPAEPEMPSEPELRTPPDTKRHELVVFNPGELEVRREIFIMKSSFSCGEWSPPCSAETASHRSVGGCGIAGGSRYYQVNIIDRMVINVIK